MQLVNSTVKNYAGTWLFTGAPMNVLNAKFAGELGPRRGAMECMDCEARCGS